MTVDWGAPFWLALLPLLPAIAYALRRVSLGSVVHPRTAGLAARRIRGARWAILPDVLRLAILALLIVALARPRVPTGPELVAAEGVPIVVVIDISSSMLAEDFRPRNRLTVALQSVAEFIEARPADPIGLVAFAGEAITLVPITTYHPVLASALANLQVGLLEDGTAIGEGVAIAVNRLRDVPAESRVVILMSDGENNRGAIAPLEAAQAAAAFGIQVFSIGVGSGEVARVPVGRAGQGVRYAELAAGLDEPLLREIAALTRGAYFRATDPTALRQIYAHIDRLVGAPVDAERRVEYSEWYLPLLAVAGLMLAGEWALRGSRWGVVPG
jgi:Ca-activated chloride channel homolog